VWLIVTLIIICALAIFVYVIYIKVINKVKNLSSEFFGTTDVLAGLKQVELENSNVPLSVSGGNAIYLPRIQKDFPDFHKDVADDIIERFIRGLILSDSAMYSSNCSEGLLQEIKQTNKLSIVTNVTIHKTAISNYSKTSEYATIKYQCAFEYMWQVKEQHKYEVEYTFMFKDTEKESFSVRCTYCGAPIENSNTCEFCGTIIVRNIEKVWKITNYSKIQ